MLPLCLIFSRIGRIEIIYIHKGNIPPEFAEAKRNFNHYDDLHKIDKDILKKPLIEEQGYICAYCMGRIDMENSTLEHYIPRNGKDGVPEKSLDYNNLLAVCNNGRNDKSRDRQCDVSREDIKLHINPCKEGDMQCIKYKKSGEIYTGNKEFDDDLNITLNLNNKTLMSNRKAALEAALKVMYKHCKGEWKEEYIQKYLDKYNCQSRKSEYVGIIIFELKKRMRRFT